MLECESKDRCFGGQVLGWHLRPLTPSVVSRYDGVTKTVPLTSQMTAQEMGNMVVSTRGLTSCSGWTVSIQDVDDEHFFNCDTAVLDYIAEKEADAQFKFRLTG